MYVMRTSSNIWPPTYIKKEKRWIKLTPPFQQHHFPCECIPMNDAFPPIPAICITLLSYTFFSSMDPQIQNSEFQKSLPLREHPYEWCLPPHPHLISKVLSCQWHLPKSNSFTSSASLPMMPSPPCIIGPATLYHLLQVTHAHCSI